jgi:hypothetical protein
MQHGCTQLTQPSYEYQRGGSAGEAAFATLKNVDQQSAPADGPQHLVSAGVLGLTAAAAGGDASAVQDGGAGRPTGHACGDAVAVDQPAVPAGEPQHLVPAGVMEGFGSERHEGTDGVGTISQCVMEDVGASTPAADASAQPSRIGPAEALLLSFPKVQGVVFGSYSELSDCGHKLLEEAALSAAGKDFASVGALSKLEAYNFFLGHYRRTLGVVLARENARLTIHRVNVHCGARGAAALSRRDTDGHLSASRVAFDYRRGPDCVFPDVGFVVLALCRGIGLLGFYPMFLRVKNSDNRRVSSGNGGRASPHSTAAVCGTPLYGRVERPHRRLQLHTAHLGLHRGLERLLARLQLRALRVQLRALRVQLGAQLADRAFLRVTAATHARPSIVGQPYGTLLRASGSGVRVVRRGWGGRAWRRR